MLGAPLLTLDLPVDGASVQAGLVRFSGWATDGEQALRPRVAVDGRPVDAVVVAVDRPDVLDALCLPEGQRCGFEAWVPVGAVPGPVEVELVVAAGGEEVRVRRGLAKEPAAVELRVDVPGPGRAPLCSGVVRVSGRARGRRAPVVSVRVGSPTEAVEADLGLGGVPEQGLGALGAETGPERFTASVRIGGPPGPLALAVTARDALGAETTVPVQVRVASPDEPAVVVDRIGVEAASVEVEGFVAWPDGLPAGTLVVAATPDGRGLGTARADRARPDVARRLPGVVADARCGFRLALDRAAVEPELLLDAVAPDGRLARRARVALGPAVPRAGASSPGGAALDARVRPGWSVLDWGAGVRTGRVAVELLRPLVPGPRLPHRDAGVDVVALPAGASPARLAEATRVARGLVLRAAGDAYEVAWRGPAGAERLPSVSVVVHAHGSEEEADACLEALFAEPLDDLELEVIARADAGGSGTAELLGRWAAREPRLRADDPDAEGGVDTGGGEALVLLDGATEPRPGWLRALLRTLVDHPEAGVVGSRLLDADGTVQDAGGVVFADGSTWSLGRGAAPEDPRFRALRRVDAVASAALATRRAVWDAVGGLELRGDPDPQRDAAYAFAVRAAGWDVLSQPDAEVVHRGGPPEPATGGDPRFAEAWVAALAGQPARPDDPDAAPAVSVSPPAPGRRGPAPVAS